MVRDKLGPKEADQVFFVDGSQGGYHVYLKKYNLYIII